MQQNNETDKDYIEKRKYPRLPIKITFQCEPHADTEDGLLHFFSKDLCCGGVFLEENPDIAEGSILNMEFNLPDAEDTVDTCIIVVEVNVDGETMVIGALADSVQEVFELAEDQIEPPPSIGTRLDTDFIRGMGKQGEQFTINFMKDYINATNREAQATLAGDTWTVTIDGTDIYEVPLALIEGG